MIDLHYHPGNASMAPHMLLQHLGLPHRLVLVDRAQGAHKQPAYLALNPNGLIPVLVDGDLVLYEAAAICLHLADRAPQAGLLGAPGSAQRAQAYKWLAWMGNTLQPTLMHHFYPERVLGTEGAAAACRALVQTHAQAEVGRLLGQLETALRRHGGPWLLGDTLCVADFYGLMLCRWTRHFQGEAAAPARTRPVLDAWLQRTLSLPSVQRALAAEGLEAPFV